MKRSILCILLLCFPLFVHANHATLDDNPFNTMPVDSSGNVTASYFTQMREHLAHELAQRDGRKLFPFIYSGGLHAAPAGLTSAAFATEAFVPERVNISATAITYVASATDTCWTIVSSDTDGITGWTQVTSSAASYYYLCEGDGTPTFQVLPANSAWLMRLDVLSSVISSVADIRESNAIGSVINVKDPLFGALGDGVTDDTAAIQLAVDYAQSELVIAGEVPQTSQRVIYFPGGRY